MQADTSMKIQEGEKTVRPRPQENAKQTSKKRKSSVRSHQNNEAPSHNLFPARKKALLKKRLRPDTNLLPEVKQGQRSISKSGGKDEKNKEDDVEMKQADDDQIDLNQYQQYAEEKAEVPSLLVNLRRQIEFYLSTSNLTRDKFLREILKTNTPNKPHNCIQLTTFLKFNRIKSLLEGKGPSDVQKVQRPANVRPEAIILSEELENRSKDPNYQIRTNEAVAKPGFVSVPNAVIVPFGPKFDQDKKAVYKKLILPNIKEDYRNNYEYQRLNEDDKINITLLAHAVKKSKVVKLCKDKFNIKRRIPFTFKSDDCKLSLQSVAFVKIRAVESDSALAPSAEQVAPLFQPFGLKWIKVKKRGEFFVAEIELKDPNQVKSSIESLQGTTFVEDKFRVESIERKMIDIKIKKKDQRGKDGLVNNDGEKPQTAIVSNHQDVDMNGQEGEDDQAANNNLSSIGWYLKMTFNKHHEMKIFERKKADDNMVDDGQPPAKALQPGYKEGINLFIYEAMKDKQSLRRLLNQVSQVDPIQIDVFKSQLKVVLKFKSRSEIDRCTDKLMAAKYAPGLTKTQSSSQKKLKLKGKSSKQKQIVELESDKPIEQIEYSLKNKEHCCLLVPKLVDKIDTLDDEEIQGYDRMLEKKRQKHDLYLKKKKKQRGKKNRVNGNNNK